MSGSRRAEQFSTVTFIVMCLTVAAAAVNHVVVSRSTPPGPPRPQPLAAGTRLDLPSGLTRDGQAPALLLVLSTTCKYCTASMPFYARLAGLPAVRDGRARLTVVSMQTPPQMRAYLDAHGLAADSIVTSRESGFSVGGTPTVVLTDARGVVVDSWSGQLPVEEENNVVEAINKVVKQEGP